MGDMVIIFKFHSTSFIAKPKTTSNSNSNNIVLLVLSFLWPDSMRSASNHMSISPSSSLSFLLMILMPLQSSWHDIVRPSKRLSLSSRRTLLKPFSNREWRRSFWGGGLWAYFQISAERVGAYLRGILKEVGCLFQEKW